jgi:hypothetical protein
MRMTPKNVFKGIWKTSSFECSRVMYLYHNLCYGDLLERWGVTSCSRDRLDMHAAHSLYTQSMQSKGLCNEGEMGDENEQRKEGKGM